MTELSCALMWLWHRTTPQRVVPANAGTHNHRTQKVRKGLYSSANSTGHGVWVPAFQAVSKVSLLMWHGGDF
jgi:hypothetical protein